MDEPGDIPETSEDPPDDGTPDPAAPVTPANNEDEIAELRAEVAALEAKVDKRGRRRRVGRSARNIAVGVLVVLTALIFTAASIGVWASRNFLNNDVFAARIGTVIEEQAVQQSLARFTTTQVMQLVDVENLIAEALPERAEILAPTLAGAVEDFVRGKVEEVFATEKFHEVFQTVVNTAHEQAVDLLEGAKSEIVTADADTVTLNFLPIINEVLAKIGEASPEILGHDIDLPTVTTDDLPDAARSKIEDALGVTLDDNFGTITVYDTGSLKAAQDGVKLFNQISWVLVGLAIILIPLTLLLSAHRRRTLLQLVVAISVGMVLIRRVSLRLQGDLLNLVRIPENVPAVQVTTDRVVDPLRTGAEIALWVALAIIVLAVATGPYPWVVRLRARIAGLVRSGAAAAQQRSQDEDTLVWVDEHHDALLWGGGVVGLLGLWFIDLSWLTFALLAVVVGGYCLLVVRLAARAHTAAPDESSDETPDPGEPAESASLDI